MGTFVEEAGDSLMPTAAEQLANLREELAAYVEKLRAVARHENSGMADAIMRGTMDAMADELERCFLTPPTITLPDEQIPAFRAAWNEMGAQRIMSEADARRAAARRAAEVRRWEPEAEG